MYTATDDFKAYYKNANVPASGCYEITFENVGDVDAMLNDVYPLPAGKAITFGGRHPEVKRETNYRINFTGTTGTNKNVVVITTDVNEYAPDFKNANGQAANCERL